jgi:hypothetical protein
MYIAYMAVYITRGVKPDIVLIPLSTEAVGRNDCSVGGNDHAYKAKKINFCIY